MTAPLKWRSQLCPCGYCPNGTRIEWRYSIEIRFKPRRKTDDANRFIRRPPEEPLKDSYGHDVVKVHLGKQLLEKGKT